MDEYLSSKKLQRKKVNKDEFCLFKACSEKVSVCVFVFSMPGVLVLWSSCLITVCTSYRLCPENTWNNTIWVKHFLFLVFFRLYFISYTLSSLAIYSSPALNFLLVWRKLLRVFLLSSAPRVCVSPCREIDNQRFFYSLESVVWLKDLFLKGDPILGALLHKILGKAGVVDE